MKYQLLISLFFLYLATADNNIHGWDRQRRCDQTDYNPKCGLCEGIGGIARSDQKDDITLTTCTPIANASDVDNSTGQITPPSLPKQFINRGFSEVLITVKSNPFCIGGFPGDTPDNTNCYAPQDGVFHYNWNTENPSLLIEYNVKGTFFNTSTNIYHQNGNMWIDNLSIHQCICADPGRAFNITIYPVVWNFMHDGEYLGRENMYIEYLWKNMTVDHWVKGPHHIWKDVEGGQIVRMWQPWNGLEVFDPEKWEFQIDEDKLKFPTPNCKKGGAWFRIKCDDNGEYNGGDTVDTSSFLF